MFGNIWRSINFNPYQLYPKPQNPTGTYYGTRVLKTAFTVTNSGYHITVWTWDMG